MTHFDLMVIKKFFFEICLLKTMGNITHENQRYYIWVCWKNGKGTDDIHNKLVIAEGTKALSKCTIYRWIEAFEAGQSNIKDTLHFERPREADTFSNVNIVEDLINNDPHTSIENVQGVITISIEKYKTTLHYEISAKKACLNRSPHMPICCATQGKKLSLSTFRKNESYFSLLYIVLIWYCVTPFWFLKVKKKLGGKRFERIQNVSCVINLVTNSLPQEKICWVFSESA